MNDSAAGEQANQALIDAVDRVALLHGERSLRESAEAGQWPQALWQDLQALGIARASLAEEDGGADLSLAELLPILGRLAFHALAVPMVSQGRLQGLAYGPHCKAALVALGSGHEASLAWLDLPSDSAGLERGGLSPAAQDAAGGAPLAQVAIAMVHRRNLAGEACCDLQCSRAYLDSLPKRSLPHADRWLMQAGALMRSVQMSHAMSKALELSLQFANDRVQFGKPIGKFQAVQHMLAVMASEVAAASAIVARASQVFSASRWPDPVDADACQWWVGAAKARCGEASAKVFEIAHQVHAAMGYTREHLLHFSSRRLLAWRDSFGAEYEWQKRLGHQAMALGPDKLWPRLAEH
ncbi:MAG: acyl-CoA dehydrogenase [Betaproteobacteria bacterium]|nr:acyl-CoA dehydrogenase [Betaproteobacteria bacterium]